MSQHVHIDRGVLHELQSVLGSEFQVLVRTYLADSEGRLSALKSAASAANAQLLREAAHSLKGSSLNIGANRLADLCLSLEQAARGNDVPRAAALIDEVETEFRLVGVLLADGARS